MESTSDYNSTNMVDRPVQTTATNPDHYAFIIGYNLPDINTRTMHPSPSQIPFYWQTFKENVEPLIKIFHIPSMDKLVREMQRSIRFLSPSKEALMFAMYFAAVISMTPNEVGTLGIRPLARPNIYNRYKSSWTRTKRPWLQNIALLQRKPSPRLSSCRLRI